MSLIIVLRNITELAPTSNYTYEVLVGDGSREHSHVIAMGKVEGHQRADGWHALVKKMLSQTGTCE